MSNQQLFPSSTYPLSGDVVSTAGNPTVTVTGIQNIPFSPTAPQDGQVPVFESSVNEWVPSSTTSTQANKSIQMNGIVVSDDYEISFNLPLGPASTPVEINGSLV